MKINILNSSSPSDSFQSGSPLLHNMIISQNSGNTNYPAYVKQRFGMKTWLNSATLKAPIRAMFYKDEILYVVANDRFYKIDETKTVTEIGLVNSLNTKIKIKSNFDYLILSDVNSALYYNINDGTYMSITDPDFVKSTNDIAVVRDFFFFCDGKKVHWSSVNDPRTWSAIDFNAAESVQEEIVALGSLQQLLFVFGRTRTEMFQVVGGSNPVRAVTGLMLQHGCAARDTVVEGTDFTYLLAHGINGGTVVLSIDRGFKETIISNEHISKEIENYSKVDDAEAYIFTKFGKEYYVINFPTANASWMYDISLGTWTKLTSTNGGEQEYFYGQYYAPFITKQLVSHRLNNTIYELDHETYTDGSDYIYKFVRTSPFLSYGAGSPGTAASTTYNMPFRIKRLEVICERGVATSTGDGSNPIVQLRKSGDGGHNYTSWVYREMGKVGEYSVRTLYYLMGRARNLVVEIANTDPIKFVVVAVWLKYDNLSD